MPRLTEATKRERRTRIAAAALRCFVRGGIDSTSMADVIAESGLSSGAIYSHFDSKADLLRFTMTSALESRFAFLLEGSPEGSAATPESLLDRLLAGASADVAQTRMLVQVWAEITKDPDLMAVASENIARLRQQITTSLRPWAEERAQEDGSELAAHTAESLITTSFGFAIRLALDPATDPATLRRSLLATASAGA